MQNIRPNTATTENGFFSDVFSGIFKSIGLESGGYDSFVQLLFSWLTLYVLSVFVYARLSLKPALQLVGGSSLVEKVRKNTAGGGLFIGHASQVGNTNGSRNSLSEGAI